jgi:ribosome biogenesis protein YTM1
VPDSPFSIPYNVGAVELSSLINSLLQAGEKSASYFILLFKYNVFISDTAPSTFDFLINGEFLREPLNQFLLNKEASTVRH